MSTLIFRRYEQKYLVTESEYKKIIELSNGKIKKDKYFDYYINSIYFDTDNYDLISKSLDKPNYKDKIRLRCYNMPNVDTNVFLENKKKYNSIVTKRRIEIKLKDFYNYYYKSFKFNNQIFNELDYYFKYYKLKPKMYIGYHRYSYISGDLRITFDNNIVYRENNLKLEKKGKNKDLLKDKYIMEIKTTTSIPIWLVKILNELKIYPYSFSKYGNAYKLRKEEIYV